MGVIRGQQRLHPSLARNKSHEEQRGALVAHLELLWHDVVVWLGPHSEVHTLLQRGREEKLKLADVCRQPVLGSGDPEHSRIVAHFFCVVVCNDDCRAAKAETEDDADEQTLLPPPVKGVERHETDGTHVMKNDARATRDVRDCEEIIGLDVWTLFWIFLFFCVVALQLQSVCVCACVRVLSSKMSFA
jgi:hypothetical protein